MVRPEACEQIVNGEFALGPSSAQPRWPESETNTAFYTISPHLALSSLPSRNVTKYVTSTICWDVRCHGVTAQTFRSAQDDERGRRETKTTNFPLMSECAAPGKHCFFAAFLTRPVFFGSYLSFFSSFLLVFLFAAALQYLNIDAKLDSAVALSFSAGDRRTHAPNTKETRATADLDKAPRPMIRQPLVASLGTLPCGR